MVYRYWRLEDYLYRQRSDAKVLEKINGLIKDIGRNPF